MIRTLLIDDEPLILRSIQSAIERCNPAYQIVGSASDGRAGYQLVRALQPDVVFTDVRMPVMDGLQLVQTLRENGYHTLVVILSGYSDFEYAQRAIALGVTEYLVKPWSPQALEAALLKMQREVERRRDVRGRELLLDALSGPPKPEALSAWAELHPGKHLLLARVCMGPYIGVRGAAGEGRSAALPALDDVEWKAPGRMAWHFPGKYPNEWQLVLLLEEGEREADAAEDVFRRLLDAYGGLLPVTVAYADAIASPAMLLEADAQAEERMLRGAVFESSGVVNPDHLPPDHPDEAELAEPLALWRDALQKPRQAEVCQLAADILALCQARRYTQAQLQSVLRRMLRRVPAMSDQDVAELAAMLVASCDRYRELPQALADWLAQNEGIFSEPTGKTAGEIAAEVRRYIDEHVGERLLVQELAEVHGMNYSYLSAVFRRLFGVSPNEYINTAKIRRAEALLRAQRGWKLKDIAEMVGFEDPYYFSRVFKAVTGQAPSQYRNALEEST